MPTAQRDLDAAKRFFRKMLSADPLFAPDRVGTDGAGTYPPAIAESRKEDLLPCMPLHYVTKHLQQGIESDHFRVKRVGGFRWFHMAWRAIQGFEAMLWLRKGFGFAARGPYASRTNCSGSASHFRRLTKPENEMNLTPAAA